MQINTTVRRDYVNTACLGVTSTIVTLYAVHLIIVIHAKDDFFFKFHIGHYYYYYYYYYYKRQIYPAVSKASRTGYKITK